MDGFITRSPLGTVLDSSAAALNLYKYGRKPFILFALGIVSTSLVLHIIMSMKFVRGVNPKHPEWRESLQILDTRIETLFRTLIYAGSFVLGVSQAVKKQDDIFNPNLDHIMLYGKLIVVLFAFEFVCNLILQPRKSQVSDIESLEIPILFSILKWSRTIARIIAEQMIAGAGTGFGYGYLVRGAGVLFKAY